MKNVIRIINTTLIVLLLMVLNSNAQEKTIENFFLGKWKIMVYGLPQGDTEMLVTFEKKDQKLVGNIGVVNDAAPKITFSEVKLNESSVTASYTAQGYDVYFELKKEKEDSISGSMMDMFEMKGTKIKE
jgi:hypothetical protein